MSILHLLFRRISALDPAFPPFYPGTGHISASDARMVDVIHTDAWLYGAPVSTGSIDFWPNSGKSLQPVCPRRSFQMLSDNGAHDKFESTNVMPLQCFASILSQTCAAIGDRGASGRKVWPIATSSAFRRCAPRTGAPSRRAGSATSRKWCTWASIVRRGECDCMQIVRPVRI